MKTKLFFLFAASCFVLFFLLNSCTDKAGVLPNDDSATLIKPRGSSSILPDSFYELHNDFILWVFDNHKDSAEYYISDPVDFLNFTSRKWFQFTGEVMDIGDIVLEDGEPILSAPYYTYNVGFTNESLFDDYFSSVELGYIYTVIDSIYDAIDNEEPDSKIQQIISNGQTRIDALNPEHEYGLLNALKQTSYSMALAYELEDLYGDEPQAFVWCFFYAAQADNEAFHMAEAWGGENGASGSLDVIVYVSLYAFADCVY